MIRILFFALLLMVLLLAAPQSAQTQETPTPTMIPSPVPSPTSAFPEQEVQFTSGPDTLYGTLTVPAPGKHPAALIIAGSGPTDRNGNNPLIPGEVGNLRYFADVLAEVGVVVLRFDKFGTGRTGLASRANDLTNIDFQMFVDHARAAYDYLAARPEVDPARIMVLGHSEGALIALALYSGWGEGANPPAALALMAAPGKPYLDMIHGQVAAQLAEGVRAGLVKQAEADATLAELVSITESLLATGTVPADIKTQLFKQIFSPANLKFLSQIARLDPVKLAAALPTALPVLLLCGEKDAQVPCSDVRLLEVALRAVGSTGAEFAELPDVNHVFKEVTGTPRGVLDYGDPALPYSRAAGERLAAFAQRALMP